VVAVIATALLASACDPAPPPPPATVYDAACAGTLTASTLGTVANVAVVELSGIAASRRNPGVWWVHNDSGNPAAVYAVGDNGADLGTFTLTGATNIDWEDIAVGPGPVPGTNYLYVADIGGNIAPRNEVFVYRVPEPAVSSSTSSGAVNLAGAVKLTLSYPSAATPDAEALIVDPINGDLFIVTKVVAGSAKVYRADVSGSTTVSMTEVASVPQLVVTGGDVTAAGDFVALRTYFSVLVYPRPAGQPLAAAFAQTPCAGATATETQGEAIGFTPDGRGYVTASEGTEPALHQFHAP
jgi:hypothetical protein